MDNPGGDWLQKDKNRAIDELILQSQVLQSEGKYVQNRLNFAPELDPVSKLISPVSKFISGDKRMIEKDGQLVEVIVQSDINTAVPDKAPSWALLYIDKNTGFPIPLTMTDAQGNNTVARWRPDTNDQMLTKEQRAERILEKAKRERSKEYKTERATGFKEAFESTPLSQAVNAAKKVGTGAVKKVLGMDSTKKDEK